MRTWRLALSGSLLVVLVSGTARAQEGDTILARVDAVMNAPRDMTAVERMTLVDADGTSKERSIQMYQKGADKRLVRFVTPADVRGVGFLRLAEDRMYLYLPAFRRVRRIASSVKNEDFMGTDFSYEDISQTRYGGDYAVTATKAEPEISTITLEPKDGANVSYSRLVMKVQRSNWVFTEIDYYDLNGDRVKTLKASGIERIDGYWVAKRLEMVSWKSGHRTVLELDQLSFDTGLSDDFFTQRTLKRPI